MNRGALIEQWNSELETLTKLATEKNSAGKTEEARAFMPKIKELRAQIDAERSCLEVVQSLRNVPASLSGGEHRGEWGEVRKAMLEKRSITSGGAGVNTVGGIVKALVDGDRLIGKVSKFYGRNASTIVPVFAPGLALPVGNAPGATGISPDATAALSGDSLALKAWYSILGVSMDALISTDIESELPLIFSRAYGAAIDKAILVGAGNGNDALGVFVASASGVPTSSDIACAAAGTPKWADMAKLALTIIGMGSDQNGLAIVAHANIIAALLSEATTGTDPFRVEYLTKGSILGVQVIVSSYAPSTLTAGSYVAVGGYFPHYALAVAQELTIDPIKTVGSDNVTFQSFMYMNGKPLIGSSFRRLKTV